MKKRPFILIELLLAITFLSVALLPLIGGPFLYLNKHKKNLLELELERESEGIFYDILIDFRTSFPQWKFDENYNVTNKLPPKEILIGGLSPITVFPHYHIYHHKPHDSNINSYPLHCTICFNFSEKEKCHFKKNAKNPQHDKRGHIHEESYMCFPLGLRVERVKNK